MNNIACRIWMVGAVCVLSGQASATKLDADCTVNILNRTVQVDETGGWSMPNVPSTMGRVRARVTCIRDGVTVSGQTNFFTVTRNGVTQTGPFLFGDPDPPPRRLDVSPTGDISITGAGETVSLSVLATYPDDSTSDVTSGSTGTNYISSNPAIAAVSEDGVVTGRASGRALITIRQDGTIAVKQVSVVTEGDTDGDGLPDDYERDNGLNPNDPIDALEDQDGDGLSALDEFTAGTNPNLQDSDGDGLSDGEELSAGDDGFITNPLVADSDGDNLNDGVEFLIGSDPNDADSGSLADALDSLSISPSSLTMTFNSVDTEVSETIAVTGHLIDGSEIDLTSQSTGTSYASSDLSIVIAVGHALEREIRKLEGMRRR